VGYFRRPRGGFAKMAGIPLSGAFLAEAMSDASAVCKAWQPEDLSHGDVLLVTCPINRR